MAFGLAMPVEIRVGIAFGRRVLEFGALGIAFGIAFEIALDIVFEIGLDIAMEIEIGIALKMVAALSVLIASYFVVDSLNFVVKTTTDSVLTKPQE
jgi:hypothetical protein